MRVFILIWVYNSFNYCHLFDPINSANYCFASSDYVIADGVYDSEKDIEKSKRQTKLAIPTTGNPKTKNDLILVFHVNLMWY
jgi:hypothetical protein